MTFLSTALYHEYKPHNVHVTTLCPGVTKTEFFSVLDVGKNKFFSEASGMTAESVARHGLTAMFKKKRLVVPGFINKLNAFCLWFFPNVFLTWLASRFIKMTFKLRQE